MDNLEQSAISQLLNLEEKETSTRWDLTTPAQNSRHFVRSLNQSRKKKMSQSMEIKQKESLPDLNFECHFSKFPKIYQKEHSFKALMDEYLKLTKQKPTQQRKGIQITGRMRINSIAEEQQKRQNKPPQNENLIQDCLLQNRQLKLSELCKDIMIYKPQRNRSYYFPKFQPNFIKIK